MSSNLKVLERTVEKFKTKIENLNPSPFKAKTKEIYDNLFNNQKKSKKTSKD